MINRSIAALFASVCCCLAAFNAPAETRILPLGDSVTSSYAPYSSYRYWLWHELLDAGYTDLNFVGRLHGVEDGTPDKTDFDQDHEGHVGWTTGDALLDIDAISAATRPDIVLLDLGSNDVQNRVSMNDVTANLEDIIQHLRDRNPSVIILLAQPTPYHGPNAGHMSKLKGVIKKVGKVTNQAESPVIVVNLFGGFNPHKNTFDGTHPNESGEQKIAKKFFEALRKVL